MEKYRICKSMAFVNIEKKKHIDFALINKYAKRVGSFPSLVLEEFEDKEKAFQFFKDAGYESAYSSIAAPVGYLVCYYCLVDAEDQILANSPVDFDVDTSMYKEGYTVIQLPNQAFVDIFSVLGSLKGYIPIAFVCMLTGLLCCHMREDISEQLVKEPIDWYASVEPGKWFLTAVMKKEMNYACILELAEEYKRNGKAGQTYAAICKYVDEHEEILKEWAQNREQRIELEVNHILMFAEDIEKMQAIPAKDEEEFRQEYL